MALSTGLQAASAISSTPSAPSSRVAESDIAPRLRFTLRLSRPHASEEQRDLLLREYRLTQFASGFWLEFDNLNERIRTTAQQVEALRLQLARNMPNENPATVGLRVTAESPGWDAWLLPAGGVGLTLVVLLVALRARRRAPQKMDLPPPALPSAVAPIKIAADTLAPQSNIQIAPPAEPDDGPRRETAPAVIAPPSDPVIVKLEHALNLAQVMLNYGRPSSATRILRDYLVQHPGASVRPWLKLLEAYRHMGLRDEFDLAAQNMHDHFNVCAPGWDEGVAEAPLRGFFEEESALDHGADVTGLEQIPHISANVQAAWGSFECRDYLRMLLLDNRGGERIGFPVAVVTDILLLEDVLNELLTTNRLTGGDHERLSSPAE